jgi:exosortase
VAILGVLFLGGAFLWAYWPTLAELVEAWNGEADYSHGFLVGPFAAYLLWARRDRFPGRVEGVAWLGLIVIGLSVALRVVSSHYYLKAIDGWSIMVWLAGVIWFLGGWRVFWWSFPAVAFLWFMVPLPFRAERALSLPLQSVATKISVWALQAMGQPAIAEGHTILLNSSLGKTVQLEVEQACSGLRIFMGITALAVAYIALVRQHWWERAFLLLSLVPVALTANAARIVITAFLYKLPTDEAAKKFSHDFAGWVMIAFAAGLFALVLWYMRHLTREVEMVDVGEVLRRKRR